MAGTSDLKRKEIQRKTSHLLLRNIVLINFLIKYLKRQIGKVFL